MRAARLAGLVVGLAVLGGLFLISLAVGARNIPVQSVIEALVAYDDSEAHVIIRSLRLPRSLMGLVVGAALGVAGALIQALSRNPLADPGILGVNAGAGFAILLAVGYFGISDLQSYIWFAFLGAIVATLVVYSVASAGKNGATPISLTLAGLAVGAVLMGVSTALTLLDPGAFDRLRNWNAGTLAGADPITLMTILPFIAAGLILAALASRALNAVALGDDLARSLGTDVARTRAVVVVAVTLLAGAATAAVGPIAFVGLMVPHLARWWVGPDQRWIILYSVVLAPCLLLASDILGRLVMRPEELPVAIVTAFLGAPVLILLARRRKVSGL